MHQLQRGGVDGIAAKIAEEIRVFFEDEHLHTGAGEQKAEHHSCRPSSHNAAAGLYGFELVFVHGSPQQKIAAESRNARCGETSVRTVKWCSTLFTRTIIWDGPAPARRAPVGL